MSWRRGRSPPWWSSTRGAASRVSSISTICGGRSYSRRPGGRMPGFGKDAMTCRRPFASRARRIALILMDVDGVLTDGGISFIEGTAEAKTYDARDGVGLSIARRIGLRTGVISGRGSAAVSRRAEELGMHEVHLRVRDKLAAYERILRRQKLADAQVCYI